MALHGEGYPWKQKKTYGKEQDTRIYILVVSHKGMILYFFFVCNRVTHRIFPQAQAGADPDQKSPGVHVYTKLNNLKYSMTKNLCQNEAFHLKF